MHPIGRFGPPAGLAACIVLLASDEAGRTVRFASHSPA